MTHCRRLVTAAAMIGGVLALMPTVVSASSSEPPTVLEVLNRDHPTFTDAVRTAGMEDTFESGTVTVLVPNSDSGFDLSTPEGATGFVQAYTINRSVTPEQMHAGITLN